MARSVAVALLAAVALASAALAGATNGQAVVTTSVVTTATVPIGRGGHSQKPSHRASVKSGVKHSVTVSHHTSVRAPSKHVVSKRVVSTRSSSARSISSAVRQFQLNLAIRRNSPFLYSQLQGSRFQRLMTYLLAQGKRYTVFLPTDAAVKRFQAAKPRAGCPRRSLSDELLHQVVPGKALDYKTLGKLKRGTRISVMGSMKLVVVSNGGAVQLQVRSSRNKLVSASKITVRDVKVSSKVTVHYVDAVLMSC